MNRVVYNGRMYFTMEWGTWDNTLGDGDYFHAASVLSVAEDADLLVAENWNIAQPVKYDYSNPLAAKGKKGEIRENIEGNMVVFPDGNLYNVMRYQTTPESDP